MRFLLLVLFVGTMSGQALGFDTGLGPGLSVKNAMLYATFTAIAIQSAIQRNRRVELLPVLLPYVLLIMYAGMSWFFTVVFLENPFYQPLLTLIRLKAKLIDQFLILLVFFFGLVTTKDALWLAKALCWVIAAGCLVTVVDTFNIPDLGIITVRSFDGRVEGIIGSAQDFGGLCAFFLPAMVALWFVEQRWRRSLALLAIAVTVISLLLSVSRGAMVGLVCGLLFSLFALRRHISGVMLTRAAVVFLVLAAVAVIVVLSTEYGSLLQDRLTTGMSTGDLESVSSGRTRIWAGAVRQMADDPFSFIIGMGWEAYFQTAGDRYATHSVYLDRLYNLGIIGLSLFVLMFANAILTLRRSLAYASSADSPFIIAAIVGTAAFMISMAFSNTENAGMYNWAFIALALRLAIEAQSATVSSQAPLRAPPIREPMNRATRPTSFTPR
jgi:O-antigen ligase